MCARKISFSMTFSASHMKKFIYSSKIKMFKILIICRLFLPMPTTADCSDNRPRLRVWPMYRYSSRRNNKCCNGPKVPVIKLSFELHHFYHSLRLLSVACILLKQHLILASSLVLLDFNSAFECV